MDAVVEEVEEKTSGLLLRGGSLLRDDEED